MPAEKALYKFVIMIMIMIMIIIVIISPPSPPLSPPPTRDVQFVWEMYSHRF